MAGHCSVDADEDEQESEIEFGNPNSLNSPLIFAGSEGTDDEGSSDGGNQFSILDALFATLRKSLVMCSVGPEEDAGGSLDIGWPTDVRHVAHVTFDRFDGFLGLPVEFEPDVPCRAPSASASIFGVSARSMQCSYDKRGNSVPTMLLLMQRHLYLRGGLQAEGIFRITAENSQEVYVREQLNTGIVPLGIDVHCLAGLIKAWFRELPTGVLDCITPDQMMQCNNEEECSRLVGMLPTTEAALLDWAINLMADVVEHEHHNKMNARNIAMVFAPNMTQMADPLTALIHAVQVMNFLKTLIMKTLREREEADVEASVFQSCCESPRDKEGIHSSKSTEAIGGSSHIVAKDLNGNDRAALGKFLFSSEHVFENNIKQSFLSFDKKSDAAEAHELSSGKCSPANQYTDVVEGGSKTRWGNVDVEGLLDRINIRKRVRKLCRHPVFQFSKYVKKSGDLGFVNSRCGEGREAWAS